MEKTMLILAGTYQQYQEYIHSHEHELRGYRTVCGDRAEKIQGTLPDEFIVIGTFWDRKDAGDAYDLAKERTEIQAARASQQASTK